MTHDYEDKGRQHRDWHLALLFIPLLSLSCAAYWGWRSLADSRVSVAISPPPPAASPQPLVGGERVSPDAAAEKLTLASWQDAHPFLPTKLASPNDSTAARAKRLVEFLSALTDLRQRTQRVLEAELSEPEEQRGVALAALAAQWDELKSTDKFQELVDLSQWSATRARLWQARTTVAREIERARELAKEERFAEIELQLQAVSKQVQPLREQPEFQAILGESLPRLERLQAQAGELAVLKAAYDTLPSAPDEREPRLLEFINHYRALQPDGTELHQRGGRRGSEWVEKAAIEHAHLYLDLRFGSRLGAPSPIMGDLEKKEASDRLVEAKNIRERFRLQQYPEINERLRQLAISWLQQVLVERMVSLQQLDPAFHEAVNVDTNGLAIGLFIPDANSPSIWNYWRSSAERVKNPDKPEHRLTTLRDLDEVGLKRIAEPPRPLFLVSSIGDFNKSIQGLRAPENLSSRRAWEEHVRRCQVWEFEAAALRNRVANFGLKGGGVQTEQAQIEKAYMEMSFDAAWKQAQAILAAFPSVENLLGTPSGTNP